MMCITELYQNDISTASATCQQISNLAPVGQLPPLDDSGKRPSKRLLYLGTYPKANSRNSNIAALQASALGGRQRTGFRGKADTANLRIILPGAMLGVALGWLTFSHVDARWIKLLIGIEAIAFALDRFRAARSAAIAVPSAPTFLPGILWSGVAGFTSFISHAGGPPIMQYLMPQNMDKMRLVGTTVIFFTAVNFAKLGPYAQLGLVDLSNLAVSLLLAPAIPIGYFAGYRLLQAVDMRGFNLVTAWTLLAAGTKLVFDGLAG